jgi:acyl carrier protein
MFRLMAAVTGMMKDWDRDTSAPLTGGTLLMADLGYQSLDIVVLSADMSRQLNRRDIPFERLLLVDGRPISDLSLDQLADFLWEQLANTPVIEAR